MCLQTGNRSFLLALRLRKLNLADRWASHFLTGRQSTMILIIWTNYFYCVGRMSLYLHLCLNGLLWLILPPKLNNYGVQVGTSQTGRTTHFYVVLDKTNCWTTDWFQDTSSRIPPVLALLWTFFSVFACLEVINLIKLTLNFTNYWILHSAKHLHRVSVNSLSGIMRLLCVAQTSTALVLCWKFWCDFPQSAGYYLLTLTVLTEGGEMNFLALSANMAGQMDGKMAGKIAGKIFGKLEGFHWHWLLLSL